MDFEKLREAHLLYMRRDNLKSSILTMQSRLKAFPSGCGTTNLTIPTQWLPEIISIAERELNQIEEAIEKL